MTRRKLTSYLHGPIAVLVSLGGPCLAASSAATPVAIHAVGSPDSVAHDFGSVSLLDTPQLIHTFTLINSGSAPLTLTQWDPSCHCTSAVFNSGASLPITLAPGASVDVTVTTVVEPYMTGPLTKSVTIFAGSGDDPVAVLTMKANLHPLVVMDPDTLDFGSVLAGQARTVVLTATIDTRLVPTGTAPALVNSDTDIALKAKSSSLDISAGTRTFTYSAKLAPNAVLGPVQDLIQFAPNIGGPAIAGETLADGPSVPVTGVVVGDATAEPNAAAFGIVTQGHSAVIPITLTGRTDTLVGAMFKSTSPSVHVGWGASGHGTRTLIVSLSADTPPGAVADQVTITLANGSRLRLPVSAYVATRQ